MSLDVYLTMPELQVSESRTGIFVREDGQTREITRAEWDDKFPGREPVTMQVEDRNVYEANITHNLGKMAAEAGLYEPLWRPDEMGIWKAAQLIEPLERGLERLRADPERFQRLNPSNGWGSYDIFVPWVARYLDACREHPEADVSVWR